MSEAAPALGLQLKEAREKRGVSAQKMADDMHLDAWVIDALEAGDYRHRARGLCPGSPQKIREHSRDFRRIVPRGRSRRSRPDCRSDTDHSPRPAARQRRSGADRRGILAVAMVAGALVWWRPWHRAAVRPLVPVAEHGDSAGCGERRGKRCGSRSRPMRWRPAIGGTDQGGESSAATPAAAAVAPAPASDPLI